METEPDGISAQSDNSIQFQGPTVLGLHNLDYPLKKGIDSLLGLFCTKMQILCFNQSQGEWRGVGYIFQIEINSTLMIRCSSLYRGMYVVGFAETKSLIKVHYPY
jgi:hypothetical protein